MRKKEGSPVSRFYGQLKFLQANLVKVTKVASCPPGEHLGSLGCLAYTQQQCLHHSNKASLQAKRSFCV